MVYERIPHTSFAPVVFASAKTGKPGKDSREANLRDPHSAQQENQDTGPEQGLEEILQRQSLSYQQGKRINILYTNQVKTMPPTFVLFTNFPNLILSTIKIPEIPCGKNLASAGRQYGFCSEKMIGLMK